MSSDAPPAEPAPAGAADGAPVQKTEKQLKREAEKKAKKEAEAAKKAAKLAARQVRGQGGGGITVGVVQNPPVDLEPPSGTRVRLSSRARSVAIVPRSRPDRDARVYPFPRLRDRVRVPRVRVRVAARPLAPRPRSRPPDARAVRSRAD